MRCRAGVSAPSSSAARKGKVKRRKIAYSVASSRSVRYPHRAGTGEGPEILLRRRDCSTSVHQWHSHIIDYLWIDCGWCIAFGSSRLSFRRPCSMLQRDQRPFRQTYKSFSCSAGGPPFDPVCQQLPQQRVPRPCVFCKGGW